MTQRLRDWIGEWLVTMGLWLLEIEFWSLDEWEARDE